MSALFPNGNIIDCNHELSTAVSKAMQILGYFELPEDEQPDQSIWNHPDKLEQWWEQIKAAKDDPNKQSKIEWEQADLEQNELTKNYK